MIRKEYVEEYRSRAKELISKMTLEEKVYQLRHPAPAIPRLGLKAYNYWNEAIHGVARSGVATVFPQAIGMAASFDDELIGRVADRISTEGRAKFAAQDEYDDRDIYKGLTFWAPNINIFRDPRWGRGHETYGEDPYLTSRLGVSFVKGIQGSDDRYLKAAACAKHFAVHSGPEAVRHSFDAKATKQDMRETYLPAFKALVEEAGVETVMGAYNRTNGEPCCGSKTLLVDILRDAWGFAGHVASDCWAVRDFHAGHMVTDTPQESAALALSMGCDLNCGCTYEFIVKAVEEGLVPESQVTEAAVRLFTTRYLLGIMGNGSEYDGIPYTAVECPEHLALAHRAALESCVLLKNDGILPLRADAVGTVGVIGPNADSRSSLIGNYHGTSSRYITVLEGVEDVMAGNGRVLYSEGCHLFRDRLEPLAQPDDRLAEAEAVASVSDVVILVLGYDEHWEGEEPDDSNAGDAGDKPDLLLPAPQRTLLTRVLDVGKPTIVVLLAGSSVDLSEAEARADAVLLGWYPGARGGRAIAQLLFGLASPSGKLPVTFYRNDALAGELPDFTDYSMHNRTYKYYTGVPLYPFGYGLSYADMALRDLTADHAAARVTVENRSGFAAEQVVELYLKDEQSPDAPPHPILAGFSRVRLEAGASETLTVPLDEAAFTVVGADGARRPGSGHWTLYAGFGQPDARTEELSGKQSLSVRIKGGD